MNCVICGMEGAHKHHVDGNPLNNGPDNFLPLCKVHHRAVHKGTLTAAEEAKYPGLYPLQRFRRRIKGVRVPQVESGALVTIPPTPWEYCFRETVSRTRTYGSLRLPKEWIGREVLVVALMEDP